MQQVKGDIESIAEVWQNENGILGRSVQQDYKQWSRIPTQDQKQKVLEKGMGEEAKLLREV